MEICFDICFCVLMGMSTVFVATLLACCLWNLLRAMFNL